VPTTPLLLSREAAGAELAQALAELRTELELPEGFSPEALAEARVAIAETALPVVDRTDIPLLTIDPEGATDLDQALHLERAGDGYRVFYAIADLPAFVTPGGALDAAARERGQTLYAADGRIPLHPVEISEDAASLVAGADRGAYLWEFDLDTSGRPTRTSVIRARVSSRRQWSYAEAPAVHDDDGPVDDAAASASGGDAGESREVFRLLGEVGRARLDLESERGGASLSMPEILVTHDGGRYRLERRILRPVERWNAQLSLLAGMEAARLMLDGGVGILRTMPPAEPTAITRFRRQVHALGTPWPVDEPYGDYLRRLTDDDPRHLAIRHAASALFRGATYTPFDGESPQDAVQSAVGAPYTHVTAPLRRLVDRFALVVCAALSAGQEPPAWVRAALPALPVLMARGSNLAGRLDRRTRDAVEAAVLAPHVGELFDAVVLASTDQRSTVHLVGPAVEAPCDGALPPGDDVRVRLVTADIRSATVRFAAT
jgi:exoribonuclease R